MKVKLNQTTLRLDLNDFGLDLFSCDFQETDRGFGYEWWYWVGWASWVYQPNAAFPFNERSVGVPKNQHVKTVLFRNCLHPCQIVKSS